jgi:hypothetical protein
MVIHEWRLEACMDVLPCPFCGVTPDVRKALNHDDAWSVVCANFEDANGCVIQPRTAWYLPEGDQDGKTRAIEAWNRRADSDPGVCSLGHDLKG